MFSGISTGVINGLKNFCGIKNMVSGSDIRHCNVINQNTNNIKNLQEHIDEPNLEDTNNNDNYDDQKVQATENDDLTNSLENLVNNFLKYIKINYFP